MGYRRAIRRAEDKEVLAQQHARDDDAPLRRFGEQPGGCRFRAYPCRADGLVRLQDAWVVVGNALQG